VGSDQLVGVLSYTSAGQNTAVGSYSIISGTLTNANNYNYTITLGSVNFAITQATQAAVTLSSLSSAYNPSNKTVSLTGSGGTGSGTYSYAIDSTNTTTGCSISISTLTYTTAGTCIIAVTRSSDTNYLARTDSVSFSIGLASQTITFASLTAKSYSSDTFTVTASASSGLLVIFTSGSTSICTTSGVNGTVINLRDVAVHNVMERVERKHHNHQIISIYGTGKHPSVFHISLHVVRPGMDDGRHHYFLKSAA
jgi:hypothetical protein